MKLIYEVEIELTEVYKRKINNMSVLEKSIFLNEFESNYNSEFAGVENLNIKANLVD